MANLTLEAAAGDPALAGGKKGLQDLFRLTAAAFGQDLPDLRGLSRGEILLDYARFTRAEAERSLAGGTAPAGEKLRDRSLRLGRDIRSRLPIRSRADAAAALRFLYRTLAIDKTVDARGRGDDPSLLSRGPLHSGGLPLHVGHGRGHRRRPLRRPARLLPAPDRGRRLLPGPHRLAGRGK